MKLNRVVATGMVAVMAATALAGCTNKEEKSSTPTAAPTAVPTERVSIQMPPQPTWADKAVDGAASDVVWDREKCPKEPGHHKVTGKVKNSAKETRDYNILIVWLPAANGDPSSAGTPVGAGRTRVLDVKPGEEKEWAFEVDVKAKAGKCVPNVHAGQMK